MAFYMMKLNRKRDVAGQYLEDVEDAAFEVVVVVVGCEVSRDGLMQP